MCNREEGVFGRKGRTKEVMQRETRKEEKTRNGINKKRENGRKDLEEY